MTGAKGIRSIDFILITGRAQAAHRPAVQHRSGNLPQALLNALAGSDVRPGKRTARRSGRYVLKATATGSNDVSASRQASVSFRVL
jgi:hypothetical protein